mmetsp:Transcript_53914/g.61241  ORF Transcript_53914/g.61241 Transcript_53914/m.61241 type:complete len:477 (-) Transcript_53914:649-2079(-)
MKPHPNAFKARLSSSSSIVPFPSLSANSNNNFNTVSPNTESDVSVNLPITFVCSLMILARKAFNFGVPKTSLVNRTAGANRPSSAFISSRGFFIPFFLVVEERAAETVVEATVTSSGVRFCSRRWSRVGRMPFTSSIEVDAPGVDMDKTEVALETLLLASAASPPSLLRSLRDRAFTSSILFPEEGLAAPPEDGGFLSSSFLALAFVADLLSSFTAIVDDFVFPPNFFLSKTLAPPFLSAFFFSLLAAFTARSAFCCSRFFSLAAFFSAALASRSALSFAEASAFSALILAFDSAMATAFASFSAFSLICLSVNGLAFAATLASRSALAFAMTAAFSAALTSFAAVAATILAARSSFSFAALAEAAAPFASRSSLALMAAAAFAATLAARSASNKAFLSAGGNFKMAALASRAAWALAVAAAALASSSALRWAAAMTFSAARASRNTFAAACRASSSLTNAAAISAIFSRSFAPGR